MATISVTLNPGSAEFFTSVQAPELLTELNTGAGSSANASPVTSLAFDSATLEACYWTVPIFNYGSGNVTVLIDWFATATAATACTWGCQMQAQTPGDAQSVLTDALVSTAATVATNPNGTASGPVRSTITVTLTDSLAAGDICTFKLYRATGGMVGDGKVRAVTLQYSD